jgi:hypothetical protein
LGECFLAKRKRCKQRFNGDTESSPPPLTNFQCSDSWRLDTVHAAACDNESADKDLRVIITSHCGQRFLVSILNGAQNVSNDFIRR